MSKSHGPLGNSRISRVATMSLRLNASATPEPGPAAWGSRVTAHPYYESLADSDTRRAYNPPTPPKSWGRGLAHLYC